MSRRPAALSPLIAILKISFHPYASLSPPPLPPTSKGPSGLPRVPMGFRSSPEGPGSGRQAEGHSERWVLASIYCGDCGGWSLHRKAHTGSERASHRHLQIHGEERRQQVAPVYGQVLIGHFGVLEGGVRERGEGTRPAALPPRLILWHTKPRHSWARVSLPMPDCTSATLCCLCSQECTTLDCSACKLSSGQLSLTM